MIELFSLGATVVKPKGDSLWLDYSFVPKYVTLDLYWEHRTFEGEHFSINGMRGYLIDWRDANAHGCLLYTDSGVVEQVNTYLKSLRKIGMPAMRAWWSEHGLQRSGYCHFDASLIQGDEWQR
jgi:hypothetical protein